MIKKSFYLVIKKIFLVYFYFFSRKLKFKFLSSLNFKIIDFNNYEKNKNLIFKKDFFRIEKNPLVYNYDFINLCNKLGGQRGIKIAKFGIFEWYKLNKFKANYAWNSEQISKRILNLIYNFDFINSISSKTEERKLKKILKININTFNRYVFTKKIEEYSLLEFKTYILTKYILGEEIGSVKKRFQAILENQIDSFSMHKTYNILEQAKFVNDISELISMLLNFNIQVPEIIKLTKLKMEAVLAQYFHKDGSVPFFNGTNNYNLEKIKLTFGEKQNIRKIKYPAETNGLFFFEDKNKKIFFDCVQPTSSFHSRKLSAGTLSVEFSSHKEKIITNCGALEKSSGNAAYLRYSAAHSTIVIENTNISEIRDNQPHVKFPQIVSLKTHAEDSAHIIEATHNGYIKNYKKIVKRKIYIKENENCIIGEDSIISATSKNKEIIYHIRFHILPNINIIQTNNKKTIILKTKNNAVWLFKSNRELALEESVFIEKNDVKEAKQIVIKGITRENKEKVQWTLLKN